ncbi:MAG: peptidase S24 [Flavobacterium sp.]|nr:peptidase S24 [Flavobacterium sp.]
MYCDGNELRFSKEIGISQPRINRLFSTDPRSGKYPVVSFEIIQAIINKYIILSAEWLISGRGLIEITKENASQEPRTVYKKNGDKTLDSQAVPLYNIEATAGIVTLFNDTQQTKPVDYIQIPNLPKCDGAVYVTGDSMYPLLKSGDIIMYKQINNILDGIFWGEMYLISIDQDGDEMVTVKYIQKSEKGEEWIKLVSQNKHHDDRDVSLTKVRALALIKASIRINSMS